MRRALLIWCAFGASVIGLKAYLDRTVLKYPDVAVRAGSEVYLIPRRMVDGDGWRADLMRLAGCWDVREAGVISAASHMANCNGTRALPLKIPAKDLGPDAEITLQQKPLPVLFWRAYAPPDDHVPQLVDAWAGRGSWAGRKLILRADWQLFRIEAPGTPWVYLLTREPETGKAEELASLYAGRCYRPEQMSDIGINCDFVLPIGANAAIEYSLGPDEIVSMVPLREGVVSVTSSWRNPALSRPGAPAVAQNYRR
ncbi:MAG: hypothetical protein K8S25_10935 [Alphaproteobacteria bacterium]|nr:hypothetical protein [Alphaproteobacteria bacterium]